MILARHNMLLPVGHPNRPGIKCESIDALIFHYTANDNLGATDEANAKYFARDYKRVGSKTYEANGTKAFGFGSTNKIIDKNSVTTVIPIGEATYNAGDRQYPYENGYKGQTKLAAEKFNHRQNYRSISYELCNNDSWEEVVDNAIEEAVRDIIMLGRTPDNIMLLRHYDLSGKICPRAFVKDTDAWADFKQKIRKRYSEVVAMADKISIPTAKLDPQEAINVAKKALEEALVNYFKTLEAQAVNVDTAQILKDLVTSGAVVQKPTIIKKMTAKTAVNLRDKAATSGSKVVLVIPAGGAVDVINDLGVWKEVYFKDVRGFVHGDYLK